MGSLRKVGSAALIATALGLPVSSQVTQRASVDSGEQQAAGGSFSVSISGDGRFVAFASDAQLVPGDTNGSTDVFVRDRQTGTTERANVDSAGAQANSYNFLPAISGDGRSVAFASFASNLVPGDTNGHVDIFVRDRLAGTTERVSVDSTGAQANGASGVFGLAISDDGRCVAFQSNATNLVAGDTGAQMDVFVRDRQSGTTERVSVGPGGVGGDGGSVLPTISADGRYVAFSSLAANLVTGTSGVFYRTYVRDRLLGTTELVSVDSAGMEGLGDSMGPSISADGRWVAFASYAGNLVPGDTNDWYDVFVRDRLAGTTQRASVDSQGVQGNAPSGTVALRLSSDGRFVAFESTADNLVVGDANAARDVFVHDRLTGATELASVHSNGVPGNEASSRPWISADGRHVAFESNSSNLVAGDTNGMTDIFVRDRAASGFASLCEPGTGGVISCPCSNPPSGPGRGCNNSSGTGGAVLSASGIAYLSMDSLVFTTSGEKPTALSIVGQWNNTNPSGVAFGQGVRCTSGLLKRLFSQNAVGGSITVPNFGAGDPSVSARSAAKGDTILPGQSRWYLVYYRDNTVLGGCPPLANFNATQTGQVTWSP